jgi:hypothetical protein
VVRVHAVGAFPRMSSDLSQSSQNKSLSQNQ